MTGAAPRYAPRVPVRKKLHHLAGRLREGLDAASSRALARAAAQAPLAAPGDEPPVVARLMVEIRSDGTRTIARGAIEDLASGERVALQASGASPLELAGRLAGQLLTAPLLAAAALRAALAPPRPGDDGERGPR